MKARTRLVTILLGLLAIILIWQASTHWSLFTNDAYPGYVNQEDLDLPEYVREQWEAQLSVARAALAVEPDSLSNVEAVAVLEQQLGLYADARQHAEVLVESNQINPKNWVLLGDIALKMHDYNTAERAYLKSLELAIDQQVILKIDRLWREQFPERIPDIGNLYEQAIWIDGQNAFYLSQLADWYEEQGDLNAAISHGQVAIDLLREEGVSDDVIGSAEADLETLKQRLRDEQGETK